MWIITNKSFLSIVEDRNRPNVMVVRARIRGDIEDFFGKDVLVFETEDSDYRFRSFISRSLFKDEMVKHINNIDYDNFKNSVKDDQRYSWYTRIWWVMHEVQENLYGISRWWEKYRNYNEKEISTGSTSRIK